MKTITIRDKNIGGEAPCFIIAEIGVNHNNNLETAKQLIDVAANAGCDAVKFQAFKVAQMYPKTAGELDWKDDSGRYSYDIYEANKRFELPDDWWPTLKAYAHEQGLVFFSSVCDETTCDELTTHLDALKATSFAITHTPLLKHLARKGKPVMISTGTAMLDEIQAAYEAVKAYNDQLIIFHCISTYPTPREEANLLSIDVLTERFPDAIIGWSDHTLEPSEAPVAAIAHGAKVIEKHITLDRRMEGPDHFFALEPAMLKAMVDAVRKAETRLAAGEKLTVDPVLEGTRERTLGEKEQYLRTFARRSVMTAKDLKKGCTLTKADLVVLRNATKKPGLTPAWYDRLLSEEYVLTRDVNAETPLQEGDVKVTSSRAQKTITTCATREATSSDAEDTTRFVATNTTLEYDTFNPNKKTCFTTQTREFLADKEKYIFIATNENDAITGVLFLAPLSFDTAFFKTPTARVNLVVADKKLDTATKANVYNALLDTLQAVADEKEYNFIQCKMVGDDSALEETLARHDFLLASNDVTLSKNVAPERNDERVRECTPADVERVAAIAEECFTTTRFHVDSHITTAQANELQATWARNCCDKKQRLADTVLVIKDDEKVQGFIALKKDDTTTQEVIGRIVLFGVHPTAQRRGLGSALLASGANWCHEKACTKYVVGTQEQNEKGLRAYEKAGFTPFAHVHAYHWWRRRNEKRSKST